MSAGRRIAPGLGAVLVLFALSAAARADLRIEVPAVALRDLPFDVTVTDDDGPIDDPDDYVLAAAGVSYPAARGDEGGLRFAGVRAAESGSLALELTRAGAPVAVAQARVIPGWVTVMPPLIAILIALLARNVVPALFVGVWAGAVAVNGFTPAGAWAGLLDAFQVYAIDAVADRDHASIILFSLMIGGMVGIISKNGGMRGVVDRIAPLARTARRGQAATGVLGLLVFFDDYANSLVVGGTMRRVTDRLRVSREKLAYIVDSTAAPVSCVAFVTTWIGMELTLIEEATAGLALEGSPYEIFLLSIPFSFYPLVALLFVFVVACSDRDFGPMLAAERRARTTGQLLGPDAQVDDEATRADGAGATEGPARAINAVLPVLVLVAGVVAGLWVTGRRDGATTLYGIVGDADSYTALMWASLLGALTAGVLTVGQRLLSLAGTVDAWYGGVKAMLFAVVILVLAWSLSALTKTLGTAPYLAAILGEALPPWSVPALVFVLAAAVAFATGTSWGTMAILMPLVLPLSWTVLEGDGLADAAHMHIVYSTVACTLAGAVWGDHCSPISDTTVLSSMACACDHVDHVRTQLPYAALVGVVALGAGTIPAGFGVPPGVGLAAGLVVLVTVHLALGRRAEG